ncbi:MAG: LytR C-terminal domain-containing protein [Candidatus Daviesbacteria bacterium]
MKKPARRKTIPKKVSPVKLGIIALIILLSLIVLGKVINLFNASTKPFAPDCPVLSKLLTKNSTWNGKAPINILVKSDQIYTLSFDPVQKLVTILKIPAQTYIDLPFEFGEWKVESIYDLGQSENPPMGATLLKESLDNVLGVSLDGYLILNQNLSKTAFPEIVVQLRQNPMAIWNLLYGSKTDLSLMEYLQFLFGVRGVRFDKVKEVDLERSNISFWQILADGSRVLILDQIKLDQLIQQNFEDSILKDENLSIGIYNATDHPGLAEKASRIISNLGGRVAFTANYPQKMEKSVVSERSSYTGLRLSQLFAPSQDKKTTLPKLDVSRAEVNLFLGEDYFLRYNTR